MNAMQSTVEAHAGDLLDVQGSHGKPSRRGEILEVLGEAGHTHFRVRWDNQHESIVYPSDGVTIVHRAAQP